MSPNRLLEQPPPPTPPWWHLRPAEKRPLAWIVGVGGPAGFLAGALLGIFLQVPGPAGPSTALPAAGRPAPTSTQVAPPGPRSVPSPARLLATGSDAATRRVAKQDGTRLQVSSPTGHAPTTPAIRTTVTVTSTPPTTQPSSTTSTDGEGPAPEGGVSPGAGPS